MSSSGGNGGDSNPERLLNDINDSWIQRSIHQPIQQLLNVSPFIGYDMESGKANDGWLTHYFKEVAGTMDGANASRDAGYSEADTIRKQQADDALTRANTLLKQQQSDIQASSGAQAIRNTAASISNRAFSASTGAVSPLPTGGVTGSAERDFLGL